MIFLRSDLVTPRGGGATRLYCHAGGSGVTSFTRGICDDRPLPSVPKHDNVAHLVMQMHMARERVCHATCTEVTKRVRFTNFCSGGLILKQN